MRNEVLWCERTRDLRIDRNLSRQEMVALLNVRQNTYSQYEIGVPSYPISVLVRLVCYYNTSMNYLLSLADEQTPYPRAKNQGF